MIQLASAIVQSPDVRRAFTIGETKRSPCESRFCVNRDEPVYVGLGGVALCGVCRRLWHRLMVRKAIEIRRGGVA